MFQLLFPKIIDNKYRGQWLGIGLFLPLLFLKIAMGFNVAGLNPAVDVRDVLQNVDGVPLDTYSAAAAADIVFSTSAWGLALFTIALLGVIALVRYRAMIPLAFLLLTIEQVGRKAMGLAADGLVTGEPMTTGNIINWVLSALFVLGLTLSMIRRRTAAE